MPRPHTAPPIPVPLPIRGLNRLDPLSDMDPQYAAWLLNIEPETLFLRGRGDYSIHADLSLVADRGIALAAHGDQLFAYVDASTGNHAIYDVTTSTPALDHTTGGTTADEAYEIDFGKASYFFTEADFANAARYFDGSSWNSWGYTDGGSIGARVGVGHKGRMYIFGGTGGTIMYYGGFGFFTGATTDLDLSPIFNEPGEVRWAKTLASAGDRADEQYLAIGNAVGEILVYAGDNPEAPNWELVGKYKTSPPLFYNCALEYRNDVWIATTTGIVSLRKMMQFGSELTEDISVSTKIDPYWTEHVRNVVTNEGSQLSTAASMAFWPEQNKIYVLMRGFTNFLGTYDATHATMFVYNGFTGAWSPHELATVDGESVGSVKYFNNALYFLTADKVYVYASDTFNGDEVYDDPGTHESYLYTVHSAYMAFGTANKYKKIHGIEPIIRSDTDGTDILATLAADFQRRTTGVARANFNLNSAEPGNPPQRFHFPFYSIGIEGSYLQWRISGSAVTDDPDAMMELYSMGVVIT